MKVVSQFAGSIAMVAMMVGGVAAPALADDPPRVIQFIAFESGEAEDVIVDSAEQTQKIFERLGIKASRRFLRASLAGDYSGTLSLMIEYPNLAALADAQAKLANDDEWQKYLDKIQSKGLQVQSNSLWNDITP